MFVRRTLAVSLLPPITLVRGPEAILGGVVDDTARVTRVATTGVVLNESPRLFSPGDSTGPSWGLFLPVGSALKTPVAIVLAIWELLVIDVPTDVK